MLRFEWQEIITYAGIRGKVFQVKEKQDQMPSKGIKLVIFKEQQWHKKSLMLEENWQGESSEGLVRGYILFGCAGQSVIMALIVMEIHEGF